MFLKVEKLYYVVRVIDNNFNWDLGIMLNVFWIM